MSTREVGTMLSSARFGTLLVGASLLATPVSAAEPPKQLQGKLSWALHRIAWEEEQGQRLTAQGRRFVDGEQGLVSAVVVLAPGSAPEAIADAVASEGGRVVAVARRPGWVEVRVPPRALRPLSRHPAVARLRAPRYPVRQVVSQGVTTIKAEGLRVRLGADGTGVTVAVLDGGFGGFHDLQGGELPASTELTDAASRLLGDDDDPHGAACAEVVHDVAPGARLILAGFDTDVDWFVALEDLLGRDVQVISHSWGFSNAYPPDGQNPFAGMVNQVASRGVLFVTSAGNEAESFFQGGAVDADDNGFVEFSPGTELLPITLSDEDNDVVLRWDDPYEASDHDYDLFVVTGEFASNPSLDDNPAILASSRDEQDGEGSEPLEWATVELEGRRDLFVAVWRDPARPMRPDQRLFVWSAGKVGEGFRTSTGTLTAPADARGALTVAAVRFDATAVESFSSRGPTADGRAKPDIAGPDGVATATYEDPFFGTSAAAPHVAGAAALLLSAHPGLHPTDLRLMLEQATTTLGRTSGKRNDLGYGLIDLDRTPVAGPMISPDRFLVGQAPFDGLPPYGDGDVGPVGFLRVPTTRAGDLDVALDWASPENDLDMIVFAGSCELVDLGGGACPALAGAETSFKPEKIVVREAAAGGYTVLLVNRGATAESGTLSVSLTPGTPSAAAFTTPVRIERGLLRRR